MSHPITEINTNLKPALPAGRFQRNPVCLQGAKSSTHSDSALPVLRGEPWGCRQRLAHVSAQRWCVSCVDKSAHSLQGEAHACPMPSNSSLWAEGLLKLLGEVLTETAYKKLKRAPSTPSTCPSISYSPAISLLSVPVHYCCPDEYGDKLTSEWVPGSRNNKQGPLSRLSGKIEGARLVLLGRASLSRSLRPPRVSGCSSIWQPQKALSGP